VLGVALKGERRRRPRLACIASEKEPKRKLSPYLSRNLAHPLELPQTCRCRSQTLLDHLVGAGEQHRRHGKIEHSCCPHVQH
jgi:hypothetical protein